MYKIKQKPEDFVVKEISGVEIKGSGKYLLYKLIKRNYNTIDAVNKISRVLRIKEKQIGFAGSKDKNAITEQVISIAGTSKDRIEGVDLEGIKLGFLGYSNQPVTLGDLQGNRFEIIINSNEKIGKPTFIPNYFDEQRFSKNNVEIGRRIVKKEFAKAVLLIDNPRVKEYSQEKPNDSIGALKRLPIRLLKMYVNSLQSYLWNEMVKKYLEEKYTVVKRVKYSEGEFVFVKEWDKKLELPLLGFGSEFSSGEFKPEDFIIKQIPEISAEGEMRKVFVEVKDFSVNKIDQRHVKVNFTLPKGSYATIVVKSIIN